jgi:hypothetical protein
MPLPPLSDQSSDEAEDATGRLVPAEGASGGGRAGAVGVGDTLRSGSLLAAVRRFASAASSSEELTGSAEGS